MYTLVALFATFIFLYSLFEKRLEKVWISGSMLAVGLGILLGTFFDLMEFEIGVEPLKVLAELALALVLFTDAAHTNLRVLEHNLGIPSRLLAIGLPLSLLLGILVGWILFPGFIWIELALLATILAPTDAALGKAVVVNEKVPSRIREGLKVESGLNDGICVPILFLLVALLEMNAGQIDLNFGLELFARQIGIGLIAGMAITYLADLLIHRAIDKHEISPSWKPIVIIALVVALFAFAQILEGSGFIACFVGGILYGKINQQDKAHLLESAEGAGDTLGLLTWFLFGIISPSGLIKGFSWEVLVYALLSLTLIRMLPVFLSLLRTDNNIQERLFMGWFGPRGLASVVFLLIITEIELPHQETLVATVILTVLLSILAHGISASPLVHRLRTSPPISS
jgi:NhaP-type Na+/H+ or K+/H+ antiporter